jgi:hypothetical protein
MKGVALRAIGGLRIAALVLVGAGISASLEAQSSATSPVSGGLELGFGSGSVPAVGGVLVLTPVSRLPGFGLLVRGQGGSLGDSNFRHVLAGSGLRIQGSPGAGLGVSAWAGGGLYREQPPAGDPRAPRTVIGPAGGVELSLPLGPLRLHGGVLLHRGTYAGEGAPNTIPIQQTRFLLGLGR